MRADGVGAGGGGWGGWGGGRPRGHAVLEKTSETLREAGLGENARLFLCVSRRNTVAMET